MVDLMAIRERRVFIATAAIILNMTVIMASGLMVGLSEGWCVAAVMASTYVHSQWLLRWVHGSPDEPVAPPP
jgi:hypothetical protein